MVSAALMVVGVVLAMASIGMLYLPVLATLVAAAATGASVSTHARPRSDVSAG